MAPPRGRREHDRWCDLGCRLRKDQSESSKIKTANLLRPCGRVNELGSPETSRCRQRGCWVTGPTSWWWIRTEKDAGDRRGESWRQQLQTDKLLTKGGAEDYMGSDRRRGDREAHQNPVRHFSGFFSYCDNNCIVCTGGAGRREESADHLPQTSPVCEQHAHLQLKVKPGQLVCEEQTQAVWIFIE